MAIQFLRIQTFGRVSYGLPGSGKRPKMTIDQAVDEAYRKSRESCRHVEVPLEPFNLFKGPCAFKDIGKFIKELVKADEKERGIKYRSNAQLLLGVVASYPLPVDSLIADPVAYLDFEKWCLLNMKFMESEYGASVLGAVVHVDESRPHIHCLVGPTVLKDRLSVIPHHPGLLFNRCFPPETSKQKVKDYKAAMSKLQDRYFEAVGMAMGWDRKSREPLERLSNGEYKSFKQAQMDKWGLTMPTADQEQTDGADKWLTF